MCRPQEMSSKYTVRPSLTAGRTKVYEFNGYGGYATRGQSDVSDEGRSGNGLDSTAAVATTGTFFASCGCDTRAYMYGGCGAGAISFPFL